MPSKVEMTCKNRNSVMDVIQRKKTTYIHTYIHNWSLQPFSQDYDLVSHTPYFGCVYMIDGNCSLKSTPNDFTFHGNFIYSHSFCQKSAERKLPKKYFVILILELWFEPLA